MSTSSTAEETPASSSAPERRHRGRMVAAAICLVLSCVLAPLAVVTTWAKTEILNTDRYVATVAPLASNQAWTDYVAQKATDQLMESVNVQQVAADALPKKAQFLAAPIATGFRTVVSGAASKLLASDQFKQLWKQANRTAHEQVRKALTGEGRTISTSNGKVFIDLSQVIIAVRTELSKRGISVFDKVPVGKAAIRVELFNAKGLQQARTAVRILIAVRIALVILTLGFAAAGIYLAGDRRRAVAKWGLGLAISLGVVAAAILMARSYLVAHLSVDGPPADATKEIFNALTHFLRLALRAGIALGLIVAAAATLAGPGRVATKVRELTAAGLSKSPTMNPGPFPRFVDTYKTALRATGAVLALLVILGGVTTGASGVLLVTLLLLIWLGLIEILARAGAGPEGAEGADVAGPDQAAPTPSGG